MSKCIDTQMIKLPGEPITSESLARAVAHKDVYGVWAHKIYGESDKWDVTLAVIRGSGLAEKLGGRKDEK